MAGLSVKSSYPLLAVAFKVTINESHGLCELYEAIFASLQKNKSKNFTKRNIESWLGFGSTKSQEIIKQLLESGFAFVVKPSKSNQPAEYGLSPGKPIALTLDKNSHS